MTELFLPLAISAAATSEPLGLATATPASAPHWPLLAVLALSLALAWRPREGAGDKRG